MRFFSYFKVILNCSMMWPCLDAREFHRVYCTYLEYNPGIQGWDNRQQTKILLIYNN